MQFKTPKHMPDSRTLGSVRGPPAKAVPTAIRERVGLSATVGNPAAELLDWLESSHGERPAVVTAPDAAATATPPPGDIELDHVGSVNNAATIISTLHRCEKQLRKAAAAHAGTPQESAAPASPFLAPCATFWSGKIRQYRLTHRAQRVLAETREEHGLTAHPRHRHLPQQHGHPVATWAGTTPPRRWQPHSRG